MATQDKPYNITLEAAGDLSADQFKFVAVDSAGQVALAGAGVAAVGVLQDDPAGQGRAANVAIGGKVKVEAGAIIEPGAAVASDAAGLAVTAATGNIVLGVALEPGAAGRRIEIVFNPGHIAPV